MIARLMSVIALLALCSGGAVAQTKPKLTDAGDPKTAILSATAFSTTTTACTLMCCRCAARPIRRTRPPIATRRSTISGSGFDWHDVEIAISRPNAIGRYSFDDQNNVVFNKFDNCSTSRS